MSLLTVADVREHFETDLSDAAIQRLLDDAERDIIARFGDHASATEEWLSGGSILFTLRPISSVTSIAERVGDTTTMLASDDYRQIGRWMIERLDTGTNPASLWGDQVTVIYAPEDDTDRRKRVQLDLVKLAIQYDALRSRGAGDLTSSSPDYEDQRSALLARLSTVALR